MRYRTLSNFTLVLASLIVLPANSVDNVGSEDKVDTEEICFVDKFGTLKCFTINVELVGGTSGGGCGSSSGCTGGNSHELDWVPDFLENLQLPEDQRQSILEQYDSKQ